MQIQTKRAIFENSHTFLQAIVSRDEKIWQALSEISLAQGVENFLMTLEGHTQRAYRGAFRSIFHLFTEKNLFQPSFSLQSFALANLEFLLDQIRTHIRGKEATKQARAAAFIALTRYLQRASGGIVRKVTPKKEKGSPTFRQVREKALTPALTVEQCAIFLQSLRSISLREYLLAKTLLQGAKRIGEVLSAQIEQIQWSKNQILFRQLKSKELEKYTVISYPARFLEELKTYIGERKVGLIFTTKTGKPLDPSHVYRSFVRASRRANLAFDVHPHVLRASAITHLSMQGYHADQIIRVSGHADEKLVRYYDKTALEINPTQNVSLI